MATTQDYLDNLVNDKKNIIDSLKNQGVEVEYTATFTDLPSKIDDMGASRLPSDYQEVEYIESDGTNQYIITGVVPNQDTSIETKIEIKDTKLQFLYGARDGSATNSYAGLYASQKYRFDYASGMNTTSKTYSGSPDIIYQNKNKIYLNNELILTANYSEFTPTRATGGIYIFNVNTAGTIGTSDTTRFAALKVYHFKIWQGDELVRSYVPAYRKSDKAIGMFDLVNNLFYENSGTTSFTKGNNVHNLPLQEKDITENGEYQPDTGFTGFSKVNVNVPSGEDTDPKVTFTGHYDATGLKTIGWTDDEIQFYQDNGVQWDEEDDDDFKLNESELAGNETSTTRFIPKNTTLSNFNQYYNLLAIPKIDTSTKTNGSNMFCLCSSLTAIPEIDTKKMTNMIGMFKSCYSLTKIPNIDTSASLYCNEMFYDCYALKKISELNLSKSRECTGMFQNCYSLRKIPDLNISSATSISNMFSNCYSLVEIKLLNTNNVTSMISLFSNCYSLQKIPNINTSKVTRLQSVFTNCYSLKKIPQLDTSNCTNLSYLFSGCKSIKKIPLIDTSKGTNLNYMFNECSSLISVPELNMNSCTSSSYMFCNCYSITYIPNLNTSLCQNMERMFYNCNSLETLPEFDCSSCTNISMFYYYSKNLKNIGGLKDIGKSFTYKSNNYNYYKIDVSYSEKLTHESLMNVINKLYDLNITYNVAGGGTLYTQTLLLGSINKAKLTAEEIAIATAKGWTVS